MAKQSQLDKRLETIENALIALGAGGACYSIGRRGVLETAKRGAFGTGRLAVRNPQAATIGAIIALYQAGLLDDLTEPLREAKLTNPTPGVREYLGGAPDAFAGAIRPPAVKKPKRKTKSKFNKAVGAGMKAVRASNSYGKKGKINNAKRAFSAVTKVASKVNRGKKVSRKGVTGTIARAVRRIL